MCWRFKLRIGEKNGGIIVNRIVNWITTSDAHIFHFVNRRLKCKLFDVLLPKLTNMGGATFTISVLLIVIILSEDILRTSAFEALLSLALSHIFVQFIKKVYCRHRPYEELTNVNLGSSPLKDYSFPSGHTTAAFSIAIVFALHSFLLMILLLPIATLIGFSRMYLGLHYPTDCIIGAFIGTLSSILIVYFLN